MFHSHARLQSSVYIYFLLWIKAYLSNATVYSDKKGRLKLSFSSTFFYFILDVQLHHAFLSFSLSFFLKKQFQNIIYSFNVNIFYIEAVSHIQIKSYAILIVSPADRKKKGERNLSYNFNIYGLHQEQKII